METQLPIIFDNSDDLVKTLKIKYKSLRKIIKQNTTKEKRFAFVKLDKCRKLDIYSIDVNQNGFNESNDRKIAKIATNIATNIGPNNESTLDSQPIKKRKTSDNSVIDLNKIYNENEELDFEMSDEERYVTKTAFDGNKDMHSKQVLENGNIGKSTKLNGISHNYTKRSQSNSYNSISKSVKHDFLNGLSVYNNNNRNDLNFRIPKCSDKKESIDSIISYANTLVKNNKRCSDAFNHLTRHLSDDQWKNSDIIAIVAKIALGISANNDLASHINRLDDVVDKIKSLTYIDDDFWDELIFRVDKKKIDSKYSHQINSFLAGLYDYLITHKINARVVCNEAVIMAYRTVSNHQQISF